MARKVMKIALSNAALVGCFFGLPDAALAACPVGLTLDQNGHCVYIGRFPSSDYDWRKGPGCKRNGRQPLGRYGASCLQKPGTLIR